MFKYFKGMTKCVCSISFGFVNFAISSIYLCTVFPLLRIDLFCIYEFIFYLFIRLLLTLYMYSDIFKPNSPNNNMHQIKYQNINILNIFISAFFFGKSAFLVCRLI